MSRAANGTSRQAMEPGVRVPMEMVRFVYACVIAANVAMISVTAASDLGVVLPPGLGQLNLELEGNTAVWYSSALLAGTAVVALAIAFTPAPETAGPVLYRFSWLGAALFFCALSVDEMIEAHERIGTWFTGRFGPVPGLTQGGWAVFGWLLVFLPAIAAFIIGASTMIRSWLGAHTLSRTLAAAGLFCWIGVIGSEFLEAQLARLSLGRSVQGAVEEGFEITGSALFLAALCEFLRRQGSLAQPDRAPDVEEPPRVAPPPPGPGSLRYAPAAAVFDRQAVPRGLECSL